MRKGTDGKGRTHFFVDYEEAWFDENWCIASLWCSVNCKRGLTIDKTFAQFQTVEDAEKFSKFIAS